MNNALTDSNFWDTKYQTSSKSYPNPYLCRMDFEIMKQFAPFLESKLGGRIIEMGCGDSYFLPYFAQKYGMKILGIDNSNDRAYACQIKCLPIKKCVLVGDFTKVNKGAINLFDVVYNGGVIEHFKSQVGLLKVFSKYLKSDGIIITTVPHFKGFWGKLGSKLDKEVDGGYVNLDLNDLIKAHEQAGLHVIYSSYFRWCDFNVLNYASLPKWLQRVVYGLIILFNIPLNLLFHIKYPIKLPQFLYSDMIVVAKKC